MTCLVIDTSTKFLLLALGKEGRIFKECTVEHHNQLSQDLFPHLQYLLESSSLTLAELDFLATGIGPGSYTGTRIAAITAKSLAFALDLPLIGFCSLLTFLPPSCQGNFAIFEETRGEKFYVIKGIKGEEQLHYTLPETLLDREQCSSIQAETIVMTQERAQPALAAPLTFAHQQFVRGDHSSPLHLSLLYALNI